MVQQPLQPDPLMGFPGPPLPPQGPMPGMAPPLPGMPTGQPMVPPPAIAPTLPGQPLDPMGGGGMDPMMGMAGMAPPAPPMLPPPMQSDVAPPGQGGFEFLDFSEKKVTDLQAKKLEERKKRRRRKQELDKRYPKPTANEIEQLYEDLKWRYNNYYTRCREVRKYRYQHDQLPAKWWEQLSTRIRIYANLSNNEILRTRATFTKNPITLEVEPGGKSAPKIAKADKQTRWITGLWPALEKDSSEPILPLFWDSISELGMGILEVFLTDKYDGIDFNRAYDEEDEEDDVFDRFLREITLADQDYGRFKTESGRNVRRIYKESAQEYMDRTDEALMQSGLPFGVRQLDPMKVVAAKDAHKVTHAIIKERKSKRSLLARYGNSMSTEMRRQMTAPGKGAPGTPLEENADVTYYDGSSVVCTTYYDERWCAYLIDGKFLEGQGPVEHGLPGVPVFVTPGIVTSSPNMEERYQGVTWGLLGIEQAVNDLLTLWNDFTFKYGLPRYYIQIKPGEEIGQDERGTEPQLLDLRTDGVYQIVGELRSTHEHITTPVWITQMLQFYMNLWQRSGLNPIAMGESPSADPSGYMVNTLTAQALNHLQIMAQNGAKTVGWVTDYIRLLIRDTLGEKVYLSTMGSDRHRPTTEWASLGPEDIDDTPCKASIDPMAEHQRLAIRQSLIDGYRGGFVSRKRVMQEGYRIDDPEAENEIMLDEKTQEGLVPKLIENLIAGIFQPPPQPQQPQPGMEGALPPGPPGQVPQGGAPLPPPPGGGMPGQVAAGGVPAPLQPPTGGGGSTLNYRTAYEGTSVGQPLPQGG